jgi:hypothetical protein
MAKATKQDQKFEATLVNGLVYIVGTKKFTEGKTLTIDSKLKEYLEKNATVKQVTLIGGKRSVKEICRFEFKEIGDEVKTPDAGNNDAGQNDQAGA